MGTVKGWRQCNVLLWWNLVVLWVWSLLTDCIWEEKFIQSYCQTADLKCSVACEWPPLTSVRSCYAPRSLAGRSCLFSHFLSAALFTNILQSHGLPMTQPSALPPSCSGGLAGYKALAALTIACWRTLGPRRASKIKRGPRVCVGGRFCRTCPGDRNLLLYSFAALRVRLNSWLVRCLTYLREEAKFTWGFHDLTLATSGFSVEFLLLVSVCFPPIRKNQSHWCQWQGLSSTDGGFSVCPN